MANTVGTRPIVLDTVTADAVVKSWTKISAIAFDNYTVDTDTATLVDKNGVVISVLNGAADLAPVVIEHPAWVNGLRLSVITDGVVRVYVE